MVGQEMPNIMTFTGERMSERSLERDIAEYQPMLYRLAYSYTGSRADCDDIMQEVFIKLYFYEQGFKSAEDKKAWLIRVTLNICKNHVGAWWQKKRTDMPETPEALNRAADEPFADERFSELHAALDSLKPRYRTVIYLHYYEGYRAAEIAKLLGLSVSAVTTRLQRGRELLKGMLENEERR